MNNGRRKFLKIAGLAAGGGILAGVGMASTGGGGGRQVPADLVGFLVDTTRCLGCRACETACSRKNKLPEPERRDDEAIFGRERTTSTTAFTVVNRYETDGIVHFVKRQCMHCLQPACASACLVKAMLKTREGPVIWRGDRCMGCRYCMLSCPWNVPKFEYDSPVPSIRKCNLCYDLVQAGRQPACVEACPAEALVFGKRSLLLEMARSRLYRRPDKYVHHIFGEREVGGTSVLYLAAASFKQIGFKTDVGETPYPEFTKGFLYAVPFVLVLWPVFMLGMSQGAGGNARGEET